MPTINDMFPGRFLRGQDLEEPTTVTIRRVVEEEMYSQFEGGDVEKWVVYFNGATKGLVLNLTNAESIALIAGSREAKDWPGTKVTLYPTTVRVAGQQKRAIRIRRPSNNGQGPQRQVDQETGELFD